MYRFKKIILFAAFTLLQLYGLGNPLAFTRLSIENGLSSNQVNAIFKDSKGFIWVGSLDGLDRYDGVELKAYSSKYDHPIENVLAIEEDQHGNIWAGTMAGLLRYSPHTDRVELIPLGSTSVHVQALKMLSDSLLGIGTAKGFYLMETDKLEVTSVNIPHIDRGKVLNVTDLISTVDGQCWLTTTTGLVRYDLATEKSQAFQCSLGSENTYNTFTSICRIGERLYLGTATVGIIEFDLVSQTFSKGVPTDNRLILNLSSDGEKLVFAGTNGGGVKIINTITGSVEDLIAEERNPSSLSSNSIYSFLLDDVGRYWVGTYSGGLCYSKNVEGSFKVQEIGPDQLQITQSIRSFYFAPDKSRYYGTRNGLAVVSRDGTFKLFRSEAGSDNHLNSNIILSVFPFGQEVLIGTYGGGLSLYTSAEQDIIPILAERNLAEGNIYDFATDASGNLWITSFDGLYRYTPDKHELVNYNIQNSALKDNQLFEIFFDSKGRLWLGSMTGVQAFSYEERDLVPIDLSIIPDNRFKINYVYEDQTGQIWVCTERGGLIQINPELSQSTLYQKKDGLSDNSVCTIIEDEAGNFWIGTLKGLCRFSPQSKHFTRYSIVDGLPGLVFTPAASHRDRNGRIYLGNEKGLVFFDPAEVDLQSSSSKIAITDFYLSGKEVVPKEGGILSSIMEETQEIRLSASSNDIGFRFVSLNYMNVSNNHYQYILEGIDEDWKDNGSNNSVFFEDLEPGAYTFRVRNVNDSNRKAVNETQVQILIRPLFFQSFLFYVLLACALTLGIGGLLRYIRSQPEVKIEQISPTKKTIKYNGFVVPANRSKAIISKVKKQMIEEKLYLNPNLKLLDLANRINVPMNEISQVLNQHLEQSFPDFINKYRVEEVKKLMLEEEFQRYTLVAIAKQCGFNSKTSFYRIFKRATGQTPADYMKAYTAKSSSEDLV